jgi:ribosomal protein S18 acetylase RimI-like enzyme
MGDETLVEGFVIRPAKGNDVEDACSIAKTAWARIHDSFRTIMGADLHAEVCANWEDNKAAQVRGQFEQHPEAFFVVAKKGDGHVVGFLTVHLDESKSLGTIRNNAIAPDVQGRGLGAAMYAFALARFKAIGLRYASVTTGLDEGHAPARAAYEKAGFDIRQENVTYYKEL